MQQTVGVGRLTVEYLLRWRVRWCELGSGGLRGRGGDVAVAVVCRGGWRSG